MYNFCHPAFKSTIESDCVCSDGYEVKNLLSSNKIGKGFLADYFVKPPVNITIKFTCKVVLKYIVIWPQVNSQVSNCIEITTSSKAVNVNSSNLKFLAKATNMNGRCVVFSNDSTRNDQKLPASVQDKNSMHMNFTSNGFNDVNVINFKIFKASYVPAIKKIEIWAEPLGLCNKEFRQNFQKLLIEYNKCVENINKSVEISNKCSVRKGNANENNLQKRAKVEYKFKVPEEFLDGITYEIMTLPMILPSGKIVDQSTLDRYHEEQGNWGRMLSDPFTGVPFTNKNKPKIADTLKSQIDTFLLKNAAEKEINRIPRRLGISSRNIPSTSEENKFGVSNLVNKKEDSTFTNSHKAELNTSLNNTRKRHLVNEMNLPARCNQEKKLKATPAFQTENLDNILQNTLVNLPTFLKTPTPVTKIINCNLCKKDLQLYILSCKHFVCRVCLLKNSCDGKFKCTICNFISQSSNVVKVHDHFK